MQTLIFQSIFPLVSQTPGQWHSVGLSEPMTVHDKWLPSLRQGSNELSTWGPQAWDWGDPMLQGSNPVSTRAICSHSNGMAGTKRSKRASHSSWTRSTGGWDTMTAQGACCLQESGLHSVSFGFSYPQHIPGPWLNI